MKRLVGVLAVLFVLARGSAAGADGLSDAYVAVKGGVALESFTIVKNRSHGAGSLTDPGNAIWDAGVFLPMGMPGNHGAEVAAFGVAVGYDLSRYVPIRVELEYLYRAPSSATYHSGLWGLESVVNFGMFPHLNLPLRLANKTAIHSVLFNAYWDIADYRGFTPYVGAGVGAALHASQNSATIPTIPFAGYPGGWVFGNNPPLINHKSRLQTNFAWMVAAGVAYKFNEHWAVDLGYRLVGLGEAGETRFIPYFDTADFFCIPMSTLAMRGGPVWSNEVLLALRYTF